VSCNCSVFGESCACFLLCMIYPLPHHQAVQGSEHGVCALVLAMLFVACRIPERYSLVIRSLLTQEGICMTLKPEFHFLEVAYPYVARCVDCKLRTSTTPALLLFQSQSVVPALQCVLA
jgi:hypothetical protein